MRSLAAFFLFLAPVIPVQAKLLIVTIDTGQSMNGIFAGHEELSFRIKLVNPSATRLKTAISWQLKTDENQPVTSGKEHRTVEKKQSVTCIINQRVKNPGFYRLEVSCATENETQTHSMQAGYAPEKILPALTSKPDLGKFWNHARRELEQVPPAFAVKHQEKLSKGKLDVYEVTMHSLDSVRVSGWYEVPKTTGTYPAILRLPGYGQNMKPVALCDDMAVFSFNVRGHGNSQKDIPGKPQDYWIRGLDAKNTYYYRGAYMDCIRAMDFLISRKEVNRGKIAVIGGSQGGGLSLATAAMDKRVSLCAPAIPFLTNWEKYFRTTSWPEMNNWVAAKEHRTWQTTLETLSYFDTMNMAPWIDCPVFMGIALQDSICPPPTKFAVYNRIKAIKEYHVYPKANHSLGPQHRNLVFDWIRMHFHLPRKSK
ncbi:MAG: alpha/beta fold hydrolase [Verrucomicrobiota bacterium]|nr:alpha/beta fold hydrolase [Verrucomicrobiota bacterium]